MPTALPATLPRSISATRILLWAVVSALSAWLYAPVVLDLLQACWDEPRHSQGLLIIPVALYMAWLRRDSVRAIPTQPVSSGLLLTAVACGMFAIGKFGAELFLPRMSLIFLLAGLISTFWGWPRLRELAFPLMLLATVVPIPMLIYNSASGPLQLLSSTVAVEILQRIGIVVYQDGNVIHLPGMSFGVEEACNGLNSLSALVVASLLLGKVLSCRLRVRGLIVAISVPLSIAVNIVRVTGTAVIAGYNEQYGLGFYHTFSGWLVFVLGFGGIYLAARVLNGIVGQRREEAR